MYAGLVQRIVFYGCELYAGQLKAGEEYAELNPVYSICLLDGILWKDANAVHHRFQLCDQTSGRVLNESEAGKIVAIWLDSTFEGGRHQARLDKREGRNAVAT